MDEVFNLFLPSLDGKLSEVESGLRNDLKVLKQMRKVFNDLNQELNIKVEKPCVKIKQTNSTDKAKEEATKLLKSGAISFEKSTEKHFYKRKLKDSDSGPVDSEEPLISKSKKLCLYDNFISGETTKSSFHNVPHASVHDGNLNETSDSEGNANDPSTLPPISQGSEAKTMDSTYTSNFSHPSRNHDNGKQGGTTIYISCNDISESIVRDILEPFGPIHHIRIDERKCYGFVTLQSPEEAEKALKLDRTVFGNRRLRVNYARRQFRPHREWDNSAPDDSRGRPFNKGDHQSTHISDQTPRNLINYDDVDYSFSG